MTAENSLNASSSAFLEHRCYEPIETYLGVRGVRRLKKIVPMLLLAVLALTIGVVVSTHALTAPKAVQAGQHSDKDELQTNDKDDGASGDKDDCNVQTADQDASENSDHDDCNGQTGDVDDHDDDTVTAGQQGTAEAQEGPTSDVETSTSGNADATDTTDTGQIATTVQATSN